MSNSFGTPWTVVRLVPLSMGFPRQEYRSELPFSSPRNPPNPGIEPMSPALACGFFATEPPGEPPGVVGSQNTLVPSSAPAECSAQKEVFSSVQSLSRVRLFATPGIAACQASLSITNSRSSLKLTSIESVMPSSHLILCRPLLLLPPIPPSIRAFSNESTLRQSTGGGQSTGVSALASFLPKKSQH